MWLADQNTHTHDWQLVLYFGLYWHLIEQLIAPLYFQLRVQHTAVCVQQMSRIFCCKTFTTQPYLGQSKYQSFHGLPTVSQSVCCGVQSQSAFMTRYVSWLFVRRLLGRVRLLPCWLRNGLNTSKAKQSTFLHVSNVLPTFAQHCCSEGFQASPVCHSGKSNTWRKINTEHCWNDTGRRKPKYLDSNLSHCQSVYYRSDTNWPGIDPRRLKTKFFWIIFKHSVRTAQ